MYVCVCMCVFVFLCVRVCVCLCFCVCVRACVSPPATVSNPKRKLDTTRHCGCNQVSHVKRVAFTSFTTATRVTHSESHSLHSQHSDSPATGLTGTSIAITGRGVCPKCVACLNLLLKTRCNSLADSRWSLQRQRLTWGTCWQGRRGSAS